MTTANEAISVNAKRLYDLEDAMLKLLLEAIHYKDSGKGKVFLEKAIKRANETPVRVEAATASANVSLGQTLQSHHWRKLA